MAHPSRHTALARTQFVGILPALAWCVVGGLLSGCQDDHGPTAALTIQVAPEVRAGTDIDLVEVVLMGHSPTADGGTGEVCGPCIRTFEVGPGGKQFPLRIEFVRGGQHFDEAWFRVGLRRTGSGRMVYQYAPLRGWGDAHDVSATMRFDRACAVELLPCGDGSTAQECVGGMCYLPPSAAPPGLVPGCGSPGTWTACGENCGDAGRCAPDGG